MQGRRAAEAGGDLCTVGLSSTSDGTRDDL
jgi:hypothetical protein